MLLQRSTLTALGMQREDRLAQFIQPHDLPCCACCALLAPAMQAFVTAQARTIDLATVYAQPSGVMVLVSPGMKQQLMQRLDKHLFPTDKAGGLSRREGRTPCTVQAAHC